MTVTLNDIMLVSKTWQNLHDVFLPFEAKYLDIFLGDSTFLSVNNWQQFTGSPAIHVG